MVDHGGASPPTFARRVRSFGERPAVIDPSGSSTYAELDRRSADLAHVLLAAAEAADLGGARVVLLCRPGVEFVTALLACWRAGGLAVPLHPDHPLTELEGLATDAQPVLVVTSGAHAELGRAVAASVGAHTVELPTGLPADHHAAGAGAPPTVLPDVGDDRPALMVFTSGTTGRPKGAVHTHASVRAQVEAMVAAWGWSPSDRIVLVLPLHHVHGIVNVTLCPLWVGATCEAPGRFDATATWERFASGDVTVFMAVPTVYARLAAAWDAADEATRRRWSEGAARLRLMVSGSAALPVAVLDRWQHITGHVLLER